MCKLKLRRMAEESGIATASANDLIRFGRARKGKKLSNDDWASPVDPDTRHAAVTIVLLTDNALIALVDARN